MYVAPERRTAFIDVDSTLVFATGEWPEETEESSRLITVGGREWLVHEPHVNAILDFAARGHNVVVWSQGGAAWASAVVRALGLEQQVVACLPKPDWIFDDKPVDSWIEPSRRYYKSP